MSNFAADSFASVVVGTDLTTSTGLAWTKGASAYSGSILAAAASRLYGSGANPSWYVARANPPPSADYSVSASMVKQSQAGQCGPGARLTDTSGGGAGNGYAVLYKAFTGFLIGRIAAGAVTSLGTITAAEPAVGQTVTLTVQVQGNNITGTVAGAVSGTLTVSDSTYAAAGYAGLVCPTNVASTTGEQFTSFSADTLTAAPSASPAALLAHL